MDWNAHVWTTMTCFKDGWESVESDSCSGRLATSRTPENVEHVQAAINKDQWLTARTRSWSGDSKNYCVWYFDKGFWHEMYHSKICSVASATRAEGTLCWVANDLIQTATNEPDFLKKLITRDESWVYGYDLETKVQSSQWNCLVLHAWRRHGKFAARPRPC